MLRRRAKPLFFILCYVSVALGFHESLGFSKSTDGLMGGEDWYLDGIPTQTSLLSEGNPIVAQAEIFKKDLPLRVKRDTERSSRKCDQLHTEFDRFRKSLKDELLEALKEKIAEIKELENKVEVLRSQVKQQQKSLGIGNETLERLDKENKLLQMTIALPSDCQEEKRELAYLKTRYLNNSSWDTELHTAAYRKDEEEVKKLVANGAYINARNKYARTPLFWASFNSNKPANLLIIKFLIDNGADVYAKDHVNRAFLHMLVSDGINLSPYEFHDMAEYLISKNMSALFNLPGWYYGGTPLAGAVMNVDVEPRTLKLLHDNKVDFQVIDHKGESLLVYALEGKRSSSLLGDLIKQGVNYQRLNKYDDNVLHTAAGMCHVEGLKLFLGRRYFDVNAQNLFGNTPLHRSVRFCEENVFDTVGALIENGANLKIKNKVGKTPLDIAMGRYFLPEKDKVVQLLRANE